MAMERTMLRISLKERMRNKNIRRRTGVTHVIERIAKLKWQWVGHIRRQDKEIWTIKIIMWRLRDTKRKVRRPQNRWLDDIKKVAGRHWIQNTQNRIAWKTLGEAYVQEWMNNG